MKQKLSSKRYLATAALMLNFGIAGIYAASVSVNVAVSGTAANSTVQLTPSSPASEYNLAGEGFTFRAVNTNLPPPSQPPTNCSGNTKLYLPVGAGAGVLRSLDGSLLTVSLTGGSDCIDFSGSPAVCIRNFKITGGTGLFKNASGSLTLTMAVSPVLFDATGTNPVFFEVTGEIKGTASNLATWLGPL